MNTTSNYDPDNGCPSLEKETTVDHPKLSTVKVSIGYGVSFAKPNKIHLADIYNNFIRNPKASHVPAIKEPREYIDQHIDRFNTLESISQDNRTADETKERNSTKNGMEERKKHYKHSPGQDYSVQGAIKDLLNTLNVCRVMLIWSPSHEFILSNYGTD